MLYLSLHRYTMLYLIAEYGDHAFLGGPTELLEGLPLSILKP